MGQKQSAEEINKQIENEQPYEVKQAKKKLMEMRQNNNLEQKIFTANEAPELGFIINHEKITDYLMQNTNLKDVLNGVVIYQNCQNSDRDVIRQSILTLIKEQNYIPPKIYTLILCKPTIKHLNTVPIIHGYKLVCLKENYVHGTYITDCAALIEIIVGQIAIGETGDLIKPSDMEKGQKYCTDIATATSVWIFGNPSSIPKCKEELKNNKLILVSNFDPDFEYKINYTAIEGNYRRKGRNGLCVQGIHFFPDPESAFKYSKTGFIATNNPVTIVTNRMGGYEIETEHLYPSGVKSNKTDDKNKNILARKNYLSIDNKRVSPHTEYFTTWYKKYNSQMEKYKMRSVEDIKKYTSEPKYATLPTTLYSRKSADENIQNNTKGIEELYKLKRKLDKEEENYKEEKTEEKNEKEEKTYDKTEEKNLPNTTNQNESSQDFKSEYPPEPISRQADNTDFSMDEQSSKIVIEPYVEDEKMELVSHANDSLDTTPLISRNANQYNQNQENNSLDDPDEIEMDDLTPLLSKFKEEKRIIKQ